MRLRLHSTLGEWSLINHLKDNLDDTCEVFFNPYLDGDRPDIIILRAYYSAFIIGLFTKQLYPEVWVLARDFDRGHEMREAGADDVVSETYYSALALGGDVLTAMAVHPERTCRMTQPFVASEKANEDQQFETWRNIEEGIKSLTAISQTAWHSHVPSQHFIRPVRISYRQKNRHTNLREKRQDPKPVADNRRYEGMNG